MNKLTFRFLLFFHAIKLQFFVLFACRYFSTGKYYTVSPFNTSKTHAAGIYTITQGYCCQKKREKAHKFH